MNGADKSFEQSVKTKQLVEQIRLKHQVRIEHQCSTLRILGTAHPVQLDDLFVMPHFSGRPTAQSLSGYRLPEFQTVAEPAIPLWPVLEKQTRLRILGKPGSGKTTLLKWIALQCIREQFQPDLIPVLIRLGSYLGSPTEKSEFTLLNCIQQELLGSGISDHQVIETLLNQGRLLLLLDELDEIPNSSNVNLAFREICQFCERYHKSRLVVASRLGSQDFELLPLTDCELADFDNSQIALLAKQWFNVFSPRQSYGSRDSGKSFSPAEELIAQLYDPVNRRIRELAGVPLLFNRICQIFQSREQLFAHRDRIYEECLALWLGEWDRKRGIQRNYTNTQLSLADQIYILGQLAVYTLEKGCYCFEQKDLEYCIEASLYEHETVHRSPVLRDQLIAQAKLAFLQQGVLLEQDCGILCFSQLAFQEHLVARHLASSPNLEQNLDKLTHYLNQPDWREVFPLISLRLQNQDLLLQRLQAAIQTQVSQNPSLQLLLNQMQLKNDQGLLYCQLHQLQTALYQVLTKPDLILTFAVLLVDLYELAQLLLLEILLTELTLCWIASGSETPETYRVVQPLLTQVLELAISCRAQDLATFLQQLKDQLFCCDWSDRGANQPNSNQPNSNQHDDSNWLGHINQLLQSCFDLAPLAQLEPDHLQAIQSYLYAVQLLADCQNPLENYSARSADFLPLMARVISQTMGNADDLPNTKRLPSND
ncbi:MAG: NACHT domain-containing protein [Elainella sp.]